MAKIVAFTVPSLDDGDKALEALEDAHDVNDVALVYRNDKGRVKIRQTSDVGAGRGAVRGALLGATVGLLAGRSPGPPWRAGPAAACWRRSATVASTTS